MVLLQLFLLHINNQGSKRKKYSEQKEISDYLLKKLQNQEKFVLAYTDHYRDFFKIQLQDKTLLPNMDGVDCCTLPRGTFDYSRLRQGFKDGRVQYIIFEKDNVYKKFHDITFEKYRQDTLIYNYAIYKFQE